MLHSLIVLAQHAAEEEEGSKTAYYVAGIALAAFAVILVAATMASAVLTG